MDRLDNRERTHYGRGPSRREASRQQALQDWFGHEAGLLEAVAHQTSAKPVGALVDDVLAGFGQGDMLVLERFRSNWAELVGADIAAHSAPLALRGRDLMIEVADASWRYVLEREHKGRILARVRSFAKGRVDGIRLVPPGRRRD